MTDLTFRNVNHSILTTASQSIKKCWSINKPLTILTFFTIILTMGTTAGIFISPVTVLNEPAWLKPMKFSVSLLIYGFTLLLFTPYVHGKWANRLIQGASWGILLTFLPLVGLLSYQAQRGVRSHFNFATSFDATLFQMMGLLALSTWIATFIFGIVLVVQHAENRAFGLAIKMGLVTALIGSALGYLMIPPTVEQTAVLERGGELETIGAHTVGYQDGGPGLPLVGWSTQGGDLRIPHFFGLHGLQLIPLIGLFLTRNGRGQSKQVGYVWLVSLVYLAFIGILTWQALRGQSIIAPDHLTLMALGILLGVGTAVGLFIKRMK